MQQLLQDKIGTLTKELLSPVFKEIEKLKPLTKTYSLNYDFGQADGDKPTQLTFDKNKITDDIIFLVLTREQFTFYSWDYDDTQAASYLLEKNC